MGCGGSKLDGLEAVALCRGRSDLLAAAVGHRYDLAAAHVAHAHSLVSVGASLHRLLLLDVNRRPETHSPLLPLPEQRKKLEPSPPHSAASGELSDESSVISPFHSSCCSPDPNEINYPTYFNSHHARNQPPPPSVSYEHRPPNPETIRFVSGDAFNYGYPNFNQYSYNYGYGETGGTFGPSSPPAPVAPPPPPSPPRASAWDFLNPFETFDSYTTHYGAPVRSNHASYTPSQSSREVREEEGIPDLEDDEQEVVKEAYDEEKPAAFTLPDNAEERSRRMASSSKGDGIGNYGEYSVFGSSSGGDSSVEDGVDVVEKGVAHEERQTVEEDVPSIASEIRNEFERASSSAMELSRVLEVGKRPYRVNYSVYEGGSSRMICVMAPSSGYGTVDVVNFEEDMLTNSRGLSSTLQKMYTWEKKLYAEVRAEEKMRLLHEKSCKHLKRLNERGVEAQKIDSTRTLIRKLSTKMRIAIQVVESISKKMNKLRDEELLPQISELIEGLTRMWKAMLECQRNQRRAISESKCLDSLASCGRLNEAQMDTVMQFELEMLRWTSNFSDWVNAQKSYVKALNGWLTRCIHYEPEVTPDGIAPNSPGRISAPPVFVVCNYWSQAMDAISEKDVVDAMRAFASDVRVVREKHDAEQREILMGSKDVEMSLKARERETQTIHKEIDGLKKKLVLVPGQNGVLVHQGHTSESSGILSGLKKIFEAMEDFTASSVKAYEELHMRSEGERMARFN